MKKLVLGLAALIAFSCANKSAAVIDAQIKGANDKDIVVSKLDINQIRVIDTVKTRGDGSFKYEVTIGDESPNFYYLSYNRKRLASLILKPGDKVKVEVDTLGAGLNINGSEESVLLTKYESELAGALAAFDAKAIEVDNAVNAKDTEKEKSLKQEMTKIYVKHRQSVIKNIISNPYAFANISALFQYFTPNLPVFSQGGDIVYLRKVYDTLQPLFPNSVYVKSLGKQITEVENIISLNERMQSMGESAFPNISLPDINSKKVDLSQLQGKPFMLVFWSVADARQKMFNNDLKELYNKYKSQGFEIYQVSIDVDKAAWATAVKEQELPWISVCDGLGAQSPVLPLYNVSKVPMLYIFNKEGDIIEKDIYGKAELDAAIAKSLK